MDVGLLSLFSKSNLNVKTSHYFSNFYRYAEALLIQNIDGKCIFIPSFGDVSTSCDIDDEADVSDTESSDESDTDTETDPIDLEQDSSDSESDNSDMDDMSDSDVEKEDLQDCGSEEVDSYYAKGFVIRVASHFEHDWSDHNWNIQHENRLIGTSSVFHNPFM